MSKRKTKIVSYALFVLMALVVLLSVVATYAYYSDKREYSSTLTFGDIQIDANNATGSNSYFASSTLTNAQAGDYILNNDVNFNLKSGSEPAYIRAKYTASLNEGDVEYYNYFNTQEVASSVGSVDQYNVTTSVSSDYVVTQTGTSETSSGGCSQFKIHLPSGNYKYNFQILSKSVDTLTNIYLWRAKNTVSNNVFSKYDLSGSYSTDFVITGEADYYVAVYGKLLKGQTMTFKISITKPDSHLANYFKYKDLSADQNIFKVQDFVSNAIALGYNSSKISVNNDYNNAINVGQINYAEKYSKLDLVCEENTAYTFSCDLITTDLQDNAGTGFRLYYSDNTYGVVSLKKSSTSLTFTTDTKKTLVGIGSSGWVYGGTFIAYNIKLCKTNGWSSSDASGYCWSDKIGDYYYLLDSSTGEPLMINDSSKTYTFLTKESSKIADDTFFGNVSGNSVKLEISIEAIQSANITSLDSSKTLLENIKTALDQIYNVSTSGSFSVTIMVDGVAYTKSGIAYASDVTLDDAVISKLKTAGVAGLAFYEKGYPVITTTGNNHSSLDLKNGKLKNITENLTLYVVNKSQSQNLAYTVTFKNGSTILQTGKASTENCYYFGEIPTKASTSSKYYEFAGWKKSGETEVYTDLSKVTISADTTFEAVFNEYSLTYDISFNLNGGYFLPSATVPSSYTYGTSVTLPTAEMLSKPGYAFAGWFENADFSGSKVTTISTTSSGSKTLYAKWTAPTVSLNLAGGGYNGNTSSVTYSGASGSTISIDAPTRDGYAFVGWQTSDQINANYLKNATIKRQLNINSASVSGWGAYSGNDVTRQIKQDYSSSTGYALEITTPSSSSSIGGFYYNIDTNINTSYYIELIAKFPAGVTIDMSPSNVAGVKNVLFTTDRNGTGEWKKYGMIYTIANYYHTATGNEIGYVLARRTGNTGEVKMLVSNFTIYQLPENVAMDYTFESGNVNLTAVWQQKATGLTFNSQGGTVVKQTKWAQTYFSNGGENATARNYIFKTSTSVKSPSTSTSTISKTGYTFAGWWTGEGGTGVEIIGADGNLKLASGYTIQSSSGIAWDYPPTELTLYAKWTAN